MSLSRRTLFLAGAAGAAALTIRPLVPAALAATPISPFRPLPGLRALTVGSAQVLAVSDGYLAIERSLITGANEAEFTRLQQANFLPSGPLRTALNTYLINTAGALVLVDSGCANAMGPTMGQLPANLAAAGIDPAAISLVALTHLHPDHVNGIVKADGTAAFPNAELAVHEAEWGFWTDEGIASRAPAEVKPFFAMAQRAVKPYAAAGRVRRFGADGTEVAPGLTTLALPGHTPGHTGFRLSSGTDQLLIWGDIVHAPSMQFAHPEWTLAFDSDQSMAAATRKRVYDMASADRIMVAGMHLDFPGFGHLARAGAGYAFVPAGWQYE